MDEVKLFQTYLTEYQINIVPKTIRIPSFIRVPSKRKGFIFSSTIIIMMLLTACRHFLHIKGTVIPVRKLMIIGRIIYVQTAVNAAVFRTVPSCPGFIVTPVIGILRAKNVLIDINSLWEMLNPYVWILSNALIVIQLSGEIKENPKSIIVV
jgi:hypothetical protein